MANFSYTIIVMLSGVLVASYAIIHPLSLLR